MKISKALFIFGLVLLVLGIVLVVASPSLVTWKQKEEPIEKTFRLLSRWKLQEKSAILVNDEINTVKPYYFEWLGGWYSTYGYWFCSSPWIYGEAKNIVISWNAKEISTPSRIFNFYVFDKKNFNLWIENFSSTAYYVGTGSNTYSFSLTFDKKEELPDSFYYVVVVPSTELNPSASEEALKRVVEVNVIARWTEVEEGWKSDYAGYYAFYYLAGLSERRNFVLEGNVAEQNSNTFNFYIMDYSNNENFWSDKPYSAYYEKKGISTDSFSISPTEVQLKNNVYFIVENPNTNINETIVLKAKLTYEETDYSASRGALIFGGILAALGLIVVIAAGVATIIFKK
jgi:hypothetical protein